MIQLISINNDKDQNEDNNEMHNHSQPNSNYDKNSELSRSHYSLQSEQSTEIFINRTISPEDIENGPQLVIKEIEGNQLGDGNDIRINPAGIIGGARKANDGVALFGPNLTDQYGKCINDLVIGSNLKDIGNHLCVIYYRKEQKKYFIRTYKDQLSNGLSVLLIKIKTNYSINRTELFMIGDLFFVILPKNNELKLKKLSCKRSPEELNRSFTISQAPLTIGRDKSCEISFHSDKAFSKIHCTFYFDQMKKEWVIKDGIDNKQSTNGVWVIPKHSLEIFDKLTFKIMGCSKFLINIISK